MIKPSVEITVRENETSFLTVVKGQGKAALMAVAVLGAKGEACSISFLAKRHIQGLIRKLLMRLWKTYTNKCVSMSEDKDLYSELILPL